MHVPPIVREGVRKVLEEKHTTLWGGFFDLYQPESVDEAVDFVVNLVEELRAEPLLMGWI